MWSMVLVARVTMSSVCICQDQLLLWRQSDYQMEGDRKKMQIMMLAFLQKGVIICRQLRGIFMSIINFFNVSIVTVFLE